MYGLSSCHASAARVGNRSILTPEAEAREASPGRWGVGPESHVNLAPPWPQAAHTAPSAPGPSLLGADIASSSPAEVLLGISGRWRYCAPTSEPLVAGVDRRAELHRQFPDGPRHPIPPAIPVAAGAPLERSGREA
jgi:hypothetical protein